MSQDLKRWLICRVKVMRNHWPMTTKRNMYFSSPFLDPSQNSMRQESRMKMRQEWGKTNIELPFRNIGIEGNWILVHTQVS